jgi:pimeloyl-ACP methyl ester carboxylesterase
MTKRTLLDETQPFDVTVLESEAPSRVVLFAVGGGGNPERHGPLLEALAANGATVIAPHFERLVHARTDGPKVSEDVLVLRARRLALALQSFAPPSATVVGVGHSIGAAMLLALAGATMWMGPGRPLTMPRARGLSRLALLAPATGFYQAPGALDAITTPVFVRAGELDTVTPPAQAEWLRESLASRVSIDLRVEPGAGHFSFMHAPPPGMPEPLVNHSAFVEALTAEIVAFAGG